MRRGSAPRAHVERPKGSSVVVVHNPKKICDRLKNTKDVL